MTTRRKLTFTALGAVVVALGLPVVLAALPTNRPRGYFEGERCACGHDTFIRIAPDGYFQYSLGHGVPEHRAFALRPHDGEWEVLALPAPAAGWSPTVEGQVVARLRFQEGALYESWSGTNWTRRVHMGNPYRVWLAKLVFK